MRIGNTFTTKRLLLVPATVESVEADFEGATQLASVLDVEVPPSWPPEYYDDSARRWLLVFLKSDRGRFTNYYVLLKRDRGQALLIGSAGYKGEPKDGVVEIGYGFVSERQGQGLGTELVAALTSCAFEDPQVSIVCAHTLEELIPSQRVLEKNGFTRRGEPLEADTIRYEINRLEFSRSLERKS